MITLFRHKPILTPFLITLMSSLNPKIIKSINIDDFQHDIELKSFGSEGDHVDILVDKYNSDLRTVLDSHAPLTHKEVTNRKEARTAKT